MLAGGAEPPPPQTTGYFCQPTVFGRVAPDSILDLKEIFGPVPSPLTYPDGDDGDDEAALAIANGTVHGLAGAVCSQDLARASAVAAKMRAGQVDINVGQIMARPSISRPRSAVSGSPETAGRWLCPASRSSPN
ncbi:aldehyde dehydrogenase family protein [Accumulibacter sp.]|uniref:aldehyde dehydrogenase family protein n=1 Tax=Accumulibacter sp. TaxID=2053492 RepID=UPI002D1FABC9|nr:aldehyde dehydrogenase family protein [Accumulibacter sp.]